jgi:hypothetical protein
MYASMFHDAWVVFVARVHHVCIHVFVHARKLTIFQGAGTKKRRRRLSDGYKRL